MHQGKIFRTLEELNVFIAEDRTTHVDRPFHVGLITGCFDLTHVGHGSIIADAKRGCEFLIVAVTPDSAVAARKGTDRPFMLAEERAKNIIDHTKADAVLLIGAGETDLGKLWPDMCEAIKPDVLFVGADHKNEKYRVPQGTEIEYFDTGDKHMSTSHLVKLVTEKLANSTQKS